MKRKRDMLLREAVDILDGATLIHPDTARKICEKIGVPYSDDVLWRWNTGAEAFQKYGLLGWGDDPVTIVFTGILSFYVAISLGLDTPQPVLQLSREQARANQQAIRRHLSVIGKL